MQVSRYAFPRLAALAVAGLALLAACDRAPVESQPAPPELETQTAAVVGPIQLTFGETGAGEITGETPLDRARIESLFPQAQVRVETVSGEAPFEIITVRREDGLALDLHPGADGGQVGRIFGRGGPVIGPAGETLGTSWSELAFETATCVRGAEDMASQMICYRPGQPQLGYVFDLPGFEGPDDQVPEPAYLNQSARLAAFMWTRSAG